eukprot:3375810-Alexandrium_andersonii.AAC.1
MTRQSVSQPWTTNRARPASSCRCCSAPRRRPNPAVELMTGQQPPATADRRLWASCGRLEQQVDGEGNDGGLGL